MMRIGVDLARIDEFDRLLRRGWFVRYMFCPGELRQADSFAGWRRAEFLAGRFAAKEAVLKVLGTGLFEGVVPRDIKLDRDESGAPVARLADSALRAAQRVGVTAVTVSIAHKDTDVVAIALGGGW